ncbi:uncharacterized protein LOC134738342 isoform X3 [Pongo pygmaeus]|uniref:uncharacterized protein LOC134738342 isoform X3 n=1 Tax=Pongo pygmaeus TaxID=9600 RepID=UPI00300D3F7C
MTAGSAAIADWMEMEEGRRGGPGLGLSEEGGKMEDGLDVAEDWLWVWTQGTHWLWSRPGSHAGSGRPSRSSESPGSLLEMPVLSLCPRSTELEFSLWMSARGLDHADLTHETLNLLHSGTRINVTYETSIRI